MLARPPIVAVLGHVDHGKTSLIAKIKEVDLTTQEFGGISQHLGAYQVEYKKQKITLIDTPGHEAFAQMRSRGAKIADLIILVVAADEGVRPQTQESLKHIEAAKVPFLVAINKMDLPEADVEKTKSSLAKAGVLVEGYGGKVVAVPVSAKTGAGVGELLDMVLLLAELQEIKSDPQAKLEAVVIESRKDNRQGVVLSLLVRNGSLRRGEEVEFAGEKTRIKMLLDERGRKLEQAGPGQPIEVLGFEKLPMVGAWTGEGKEEKKEKETREDGRDPKKVKIILKTDVTGTKEAVLASLPKEVAVLAEGIGTVNESEVLLAKSVEAEIIGFNVKLAAGVAKLAETEDVKVKTFRLIYDLLAYLEKRVLNLQQPTRPEVLGRAEIIAQFEIKGERILGAKVVEGELRKEARLHWQRAEKILDEVKFKSLKKGKLDVLAVKKGEEFGAVLAPVVDFQVGDLLVYFRDGSN